MRASALLHTSIRAALLFAAGVGAVLVIGGAGVASAAPPAAPGPALAATNAAADAKPEAGRFCTATSCKRSPASVFGAAASFGAAILLTRWLSRHPHTSSA